MKCTKCGAELADDAKFCSSCGAPVTSAEPEPSQPAPQQPAPPQPACPQCGSALSPGQEFCSNCGYRLTPARVQTASAPDASLARRLTSVIMVTVAAVMMLVAIALPWYALRYWGYTQDITFGNLMEMEFPDWFGFALPPIVLVVIAAVVLITAIISFITRRNMNTLWSTLGSLAVVAIIINAGYLVWWFYDNSGEWINIAHAGSVLVLVGAIVLLIGASIRPRRL
jgi:RNA polymerase subunit RPABC4/transcription elongation factor Spt4